MENNFKKENKMSSYRNKSILLCIITFLIGFMFLDFGKRDNSKEVENMKFSLESVEAQVYKKESEKSSLESQIENLKKNIGDATVIMVAQRISTIVDADRILVVDDGQIVGNGTHEELLKSCSLYREIAEIQLGKEADLNEKCNHI